MSDNSKDIPNEAPNDAEATIGVSDPIEAGSLPKQPEIGEIFAGKYKILERVGSGGMGAVYRAEHQLMERVVAVKLLHPQLSRNDNYLKRFQREARIASRINHQNAITLYDFGIHGEIAFLVMEFVEGETLKSLLSRSGPLSLERVGASLRQIGAALTAAHALGIVHRDLKPDNIMFSQRDSQELVRVLDFGIAKLTGIVSTESALFKTQMGMFMGTPAYMSPEQATEKELDQRSDVYTLGIILFEMLTGDVPFTSDSPLELLMKQIHALPTPPHEFRPDSRIPVAVSRVVVKALEKDREKRFQTVAELVEAFDKALQTSPLATRMIRAAVPATSTITGTIGHSVTSSGAHLKRLIRSDFIPSGRAIARSVAAGLILGTVILVLAVRSQRENRAERSQQMVQTEGESSEMVAAVASGSDAAISSSNGANSSVIEKAELLDSGDGNVPPAQAPAETAAAVEYARARLNDLFSKIRGTRPASQKTMQSNTVGDPSIGERDLPVGQQVAVHDAALDSESSRSSARDELEASEDIAEGVKEVPKEVSATPEPSSQSAEVVAVTPAPSDEPREPIQPSSSEPAASIPVQEAAPEFDGRMARLVAAISAPPITPAPKMTAAMSREAAKLYSDGKSLQRAGDRIGAAELFQKAIELKNDHLLARLSLGLNLLHLGKPELALSQFQAAEKLDPSYPPTHYNFATYYAMTGDRDAAIEHLERAVKAFSGMRELAANDPDLASLQDDERFHRLVRK